MVNIIPATLTDLPAISDLAHGIWPSAYGAILSKAQLDYMLDKIYSIPSLQHQFVNLKHNFVLAIENDAPIGFASFSFKENEASVCRLHKIYLLPHYHGSGFGKILLNSVINAAKTAGSFSLELNVNRNNKAIIFYESQGFIIKYKEDIDIGQGYFMNDYVMELLLF